MLYIFDDYKLDTDRYILMRDRDTLQIEPKVFDLLAYFLDHRGDVVTKEALLEELWPDQFVTESALTYCIMAARKSIGDNGRTQRRIKTVHGRGYRFIGAVEERSESISEAEIDPAPESPQTPAVPTSPAEAMGFPYWQKVAQQAIERSAHPEAVEALLKGVEVLQNDLEMSDQTLQDLTLQVTLSAALSAGGDRRPQAKERAYLQMREHCDPPVADRPIRFQIQQGLWAYALFQADLKSAQALGEACLQWVQQAPLPGLCSWSHYALGLTLFKAGELTSALTHFEQSLGRHQNHSLPVSKTPQDLSVISSAYAARCSGASEPTLALQRMEAALNLAKQQGQPMRLASALISAAHLDFLRREVGSTHERSSAAVALATQHALPHWAAQGKVLIGWALTAEGQIEAGLEHIRRGVEAYRETGVVLAIPTLLAIWADATKRAGRFQEGVAILDDALGMIDSMGGHDIASELYRLKGICLAPEDPDTAETTLRQAIDIAARQRATVLELRAAVSLGELWRQQGDTADIRDLLISRYDALSDPEGLTDAREAQRLLAEAAND